jgi:hypothetical protein
VEAYKGRRQKIEGRRENKYKDSGLRIQESGIMNQDSE